MVLTKEEVASVIAQLKEHIKEVKIIHDKDLADGWGAVQFRDGIILTKAFCRRP